MRREIWERIGIFLKISAKMEKFEKINNNRNKNEKKFAPRRFH